MKHRIRETDYEQLGDNWYMVVYNRYRGQIFQIKILPEHIEFYKQYNWYFYVDSAFGYLKGSDRSTAKPRQQLLLENNQIR